MLTTALPLLPLWFLLLFGGYVFGQANADSTHRTPTWARMASSLTLAVAGLAWAVDPAAVPGLSAAIAVGMGLGLLGDLFMARLILRGDNSLLAGIGAFSLGHIAYIVGLLNYAAAESLTDPAPWLLSFGLWWLGGLVGWWVVVWRGTPPDAADRSVRLAALPYTLLLSSTAAAASALAAQTLNMTPNLLLVAVGAALFLLSDLLLAAQLFRGLHFRFIGDAVWALYGPGQMLIVYGVPLALVAAA